MTQSPQPQPAETFLLPVKTYKDAFMKLGGTLDGVLLRGGWTLTYVGGPSGPIKLANRAKNRALLFDPDGRICATSL